jgi:predicted transcriptional regulator
MARSLKALQPTRPDAAALRQLATADPTIPPAVMPRSGGEMINLRLSPDLVDELDAAAESERTTRKVIVTRALAKAGFHVPARDLEDRTPRKRRRTSANGQRPAA